MSEKPQGQLKPTSKPDNAPWPGPKRELIEAILTMWKQANETGEPQYQRFVTSDGWILLKVRPGGIWPTIAAMNSKGEDLFEARFQERQEPRKPGADAPTGSKED